MKKTSVFLPATIEIANEGRGEFDSVEDWVEIEVCFPKGYRYVIVNFLWADETSHYSIYKTEEEVISAALAKRNKMYYVIDRKIDYVNYRVIDGKLIDYTAD